METFTVTIHNAGLVLEGVLAIPGECRPSPGVVLCHPHPLMGGNMNNNVVIAVSRALVKKNIACLQFNFRGVGKSTGKYDNGHGEQEDARAAVSFMAGREEIDESKIGLAGYSFGGMVAFSAGERDNRVKALGAVSPVVPTGMSVNCTKPRIIIYGKDDSIISFRDTRKEIGSMSGPVTAEEFEGVDHFWSVREEEMAEKIAAFFAGNLRD